MWSLQKPDIFWRMTIDYLNLNQVIAPIATAIPYMVSFPEHISMTLDTWYLTTELVNAFFFQ